MATNDFFLGDDDAKTYGDIDYMRKVKRVRKTFAKPAFGEMAIATETNDGYSALTKESSSSASQPSVGMTPATSTTPEVKPASSVSTSSNSFSGSEQRRSRDTNLDMFRNMARGMKKPR